MKKEKVVKEPKKKAKKVIKLSKKKFRKGFLVFGWSVLIGSIAFGVYNNFTAVDTETVYEKEIIEEKNQDVAGVGAFVTNFAQTYYAWDVTPQAKDNRKTALEKYMQPSLLQINTSDLDGAKEKVEVNNVEIWSVQDVTKKQKQDKDYDVTYSVNQFVPKTKKTTNSTYMVRVHQEKSSYVITKNPTIVAPVSKSNYEEKEATNKGTIISTKETEKITSFLDTFYKLYPTATNKEIVYYVKDPDVKAINKNYTFIGIDKLVVNKTKAGYQANFYCQYKDNDTGMLINNQYEVQLEEQASGELIMTEME
ncbi:conjugal transfer protein [Listeria seeligeri]|uniref:conjugal transfer protein n=1 Tax=Listeria seeligeri TaxID=1640 RepID=UPI0018872CF0|nr:conjugal transfer protein [Listeria seeligeri]EAF3529876.1 conjugal transfer protein [Listeria monocytogenes]EAF8294229.1 conjugal transfer protein [Listeria monocytogenes]MBF2402860.1 conjugal transfer protein [Listeria seeligeri]